MLFGVRELCAVDNNARCITSNSLRMYTIIHMNDVTWSDVKQSIISVCFIWNYIPGQLNSCWYTESDLVPQGAVPVTSRERSPRR